MSGGLREMISEGGRISRGREEVWRWVEREEKWEGWVKGECGQMPRVTKFLQNI